MKTKDKRGVFVYHSPELIEIDLTSEGILCGSFEDLNDEFNYSWDEIF